MSLVRWVTAAPMSPRWEVGNYNSHQLSGPELQLPSAQGPGALLVTHRGSLLDPEPSSCPVLGTYLAFFTERSPEWRVCQDTQLLHGSFVPGSVVGGIWGPLGDPCCRRAGLGREGSPGVRGMGGSA